MIDLLSEVCLGTCGLFLLSLSLPCWYFVRSNLYNNQRFLANDLAKKLFCHRHVNQLGRVGKGIPTVNPSNVKSTFLYYILWVLYSGLINFLKQFLKQNRLRKRYKFFYFKRRVIHLHFFSLSKNKCDQYWPDSTTTFGSITVTLLRTQSFADYCIRTLKLVKVRKEHLICMMFIP